jgi:hypothetical protein
MIWMRFVMMGLFSFTALTLIGYQGIEIFNAFMDYFHQQK